MDLNSTHLCRLCLEHSKDVVNIFEKFQNATISSILTQHFWFQACRGDGFSEYLCQECWINIKMFHKFYKRVERRQRSSWQLAGDQTEVQTQLIKQERGDSPLARFELALDPNLSLVKNEITDPPVPVINFLISKEESSEYNDDYGCDPSENVQTSDDEMQKEIEDINATPAVDCNKSNEEGEQEDVEGSNQISNFKGMSLRERNAKIREFFNMTCQKCSEPFQNFGKAMNHYRTVHNVPGYVSCCGRKFHRHGSAMNHIFFHLNPDAFRCITCDRRFADKMALKSHMKNHEPVSSREYKCDICTNKSYTKAIYLEQHRQTKHCSEEDKKFHCDKCDKKFVSKPMLKFHIRADHELLFAQVCDICARVFKNKSVLRAHMRVHATSPKQKVECNICGAWLTNERGLRNHLMRHQDTSAKCSICSKVLQNKFSLTNHIRIAHGERRHQCTLCDKKFMTPIILKEHMAGHTGQDLYECAYCPKTFKSSGNMFSHRKRAHFEEWNRDCTKRRIVEQTSTK